MLLLLLLLLIPTGLAVLDHLHESVNIQEVEEKKRVYLSLHPAEVHTVQKLLMRGTVGIDLAQIGKTLAFIVEGQEANMTRGKAREGSLHFSVAF
ncbi:hypothetical protein CDAR_245671 [Caerostris darwini]|uniref:Uncharacterized protein n=1 Tax=Caerostris darwini TaxID=1538125 RepID=A0AAV4UQ31_9ARAC|nr:hypothetical protein CDAR_245671 [Caerostris darwini]